MLKDHGTERDTESLLNSTGKYPFSRFSHSMRMKDLFESYDTKLMKVIPNQGYAIRRVLGEGSNSTKIRIIHRIFLHALRLIINGVVNREFIFKLPYKNLDAKIKVIELNQKQSKPLFRYCKGRADPFDLGFQMNGICIEIKYPNRPTHRFGIHVPKHMYDIMIDNKAKNLTYQNSNISTLTEITTQMEEMFPEIQRSSISSCIRHGLNMMFKGMIHRVDSYINLDSGKDAFFVYLSGSFSPTQYVKVRRKVRFLMKNKKNKPKHDGTFYFSLTDKNMELFNKGETVKASFTRYLEELTACKNYAMNIYKMEFKDDLRYAFFQDIQIDNENAKYIYRWNDNGFESINDT